MNKDFLNNNKKYPSIKKISKALRFYKYFFLTTNTKLATGQYFTNLLWSGNWNLANETCV
jgi:hypothetical protein